MSGFVVLTRARPDSDSSGCLWYSWARSAAGVPVTVRRHQGRWCPREAVGPLGVAPRADPRRWPPGPDRAAACTLAGPEEGGRGHRRHAVPPVPKCARTSCGGAQRRRHTDRDPASGPV